MVYYKASALWTPLVQSTYLLLYKTDVFEGTSTSHNLRDVYQYFQKPTLYQMDTRYDSWLWGDPLVPGVMAGVQATNIWNRIEEPSIRLRWDVYATTVDGVGGTFVGEVITPLRDISAYNTRT